MLTCGCLFKIGYLSSLGVVRGWLFVLVALCLFVSVLIVVYCLVVFGWWVFACVWLLWFASLRVVFLGYVWLWFTFCV